MRYRIVEARTVEPSGFLYLEVEFMDGTGKVIHRNDFVMQIAHTARRPVKDRLGRLQRADGSWVAPSIGPEGQVRYPEPDQANPYKQETVEIDVAAVAHENIRNYIARMRARSAVRFDACDLRIPTSERDPGGLIAEMNSHVGKVFE